ncbi:MAG: DUF975 family protein [Clostridium perfringens]|nr:DUF975 family protein [Clostridium perfringens]
MRRASEIKLDANKALIGKRGTYILELLTFYIIESLMIGFALTFMVTSQSGVVYTILIIICGIIQTLLIIGIISYGVNLNVNREEATYSNMFSGFSDRAVQKIFLVILLEIIQGIGYICFVIPGIYLTLRLNLALYIINNGDYTAIEALKESWRLTKGHALDFLLFNLTFIGWFIIVIITAGIAILWVGPYYITATSYFYTDLLSEKKETLN